ncbi:hypothetical protein BGW42_008321 [Actinomortierella wolfii]|nr:hypothetical protein BGW42_008321 [Actinomortierella wolfii]
MVSLQMQHMQQSVDSQLLKKNNAVFLARRIQFKEATRVDLKQERLKKKYRPVNLPAADQNGSSPAPVYSGGNASASNGPSANSVVSEDANGFRYPAKILFSKSKVQLSWPQPRPIGPGLGNLGNTCFLNSVLQCLTYTAPLANYLLSSQHSSSYIGKQFRLGRQEDSHEFARYFVDALQKSCLVGYDSKLDNRIKETTAIHQIFGGYFQSQIKCMRCGYESNTFETHLDISLDIKGADNVAKAFRDFIKPEILNKSNQYKCDKCKMLVDARKQMTIYEAPKILSVHLKRFTFTGQKINRHVAFDTKLDLNPVMSTNKTHPDLKYSLYAVLVHAGGSCHSGHYYCFVKSSNGIWYSMNDSHVSVVSLQTVLNQSAYMLFYTQDQPGAKKSAANGVNGVHANGKAAPQPNGAHNKAAPQQQQQQQQQQKRPRPDDDDLGDKVDRSSVGIKPAEKKIKISENGGEDLSKLTKEERIRRKKELKRQRKLERLRAQAAAEGKESSSSSSSQGQNGESNGKQKLNDYELATQPRAATSSSAPSTPLLFGAPLGKSPLADLDEKPMVNGHNHNGGHNNHKQAANRRLSLTVESKWTVTEGSPKSPLLSPKPVVEVKKQAQEQRGSDDDDSQDESLKKKDDDDSEEQEGWTVKPRIPASQSQTAIVVSHNESSSSKREKLQKLVEREASVSKSADVKKAMISEAKHMLGSQVSTWDEQPLSEEVAKGREAILKSLKPKHNRPDAYDVEYDRGKVKKVKNKNKLFPAVGSQPSNKFQREQDVRNVLKPQFKKKAKNKLPNAL